MGTRVRPEQRLEAFYTHIGAGQLDRLGEFLRDDTIYFQPQYMIRPTRRHGLRQVVREYNLWNRNYFRGLHIDHLKLVSRPDRVRNPEVGHGAAHCYEVTYLLVGRYVSEIPELRVPLTNDGEWKRLAVTDWVWLDADLSILYIQSSFRVN